jgi:hypothetical protein
MLLENLPSRLAGNVTIFRDQEEKEDTIHSYLNYYVLLVISNTENTAMC